MEWCLPCAKTVLKDFDLKCIFLQTNFICHLYFEISQALGVSRLWKLTTNGGRCHTMTPCHWHCVWLHAVSVIWLNFPATNRYDLRTNTIWRGNNWNENKLLKIGLGWYQLLNDEGLTTTEFFNLTVTFAHEHKSLTTLYADVTYNFQEDCSSYLYIKCG